MSVISYAVRHDVVACEMGGGKALLDLRDSRYYRLNATAAQIWEWIGEDATISALVEKMLERYDVDRTQCEEDVVAIIQSFEKAGLIEPSSATPADTGH